MSTTTRATEASAVPDPLTPGTTDDPARRLDLGRLRSPQATTAVSVAALGALGSALGSVVAGRIADDPTSLLVGLLAIAVVGGALLDTAGRTVWSAVVDRAEGRLRADLVTAALSQPLAALSEQAVGEILDRVDDDTHEIGTLLRGPAWEALRTTLVALPLWVVAGVTWWPMWLLFPLAAALALAAVRRTLGEIKRLRIIEEMAWTDHAAAMEEGIAGRDDLRTSLGRSYLLRRTSELAAACHARFDDVLRLEVSVTRRAGLILHLLLAGIAVGGVAVAIDGGLGVGALVTLFLVTSTFVGQVSRLAEQLPDLQAGLGAVVRLRQLLEVPPEPVGGRPLPPGSLDLELRDLHFRYPTETGGGAFALQGLDVHLRAGRTLALVGRTGSGKSTVVSLLSRAVEPPAGSVLLGGRDVLDVDLEELRRGVGVVSQRTEIVAGTLAENVALFGDVPRHRVESAVAELGLEGWVAGLPRGLDTLLGPGGVTLSAGEEQLVAFARLLVRDVRLVVLDEATARMDPHTEAQVVHAADRLLAGRTGVLVAHRLATIARADDVVVLEAGRAVQQGSRMRLAAEPGPLRDLLDAAGFDHTFGAEVEAPPAPSGPDGGPVAVGGRRRTGPPPERESPGPGLPLARLTRRVLSIHPWWGLFCAFLFLLCSLVGAFGAVTGLAWGLAIEDLRDGGRPWWLLVGVVVSLLLSPLLIAQAIRGYPRWWIAVMLRVRTSVLAAQTDQHRLPRTPPGEVVARAMDSDRLARYGDRWVDVTNGLLVAVVTAALGLNLGAGLVLLVVMGVSAIASVIGAPYAGRAAAGASTSRARFGRALVSALDSARTLKLAAATRDARTHLAAVDGGRVDAAVKEHRILALLEGVPVVMVQVGVVTAWAVYLLEGWDLATALLVSGAVLGFGWFGQVAARVITEAPGVRAWAAETSRFAGGRDLMTLPDGVDLVAGSAPAPPPAARQRLESIELADVDAIHDDGTIGVSDVDLRVDRGDLVLLVGQVGSGKSSLLSALAGLVTHTGAIRWNGVAVDDPEHDLRPARVAHVAQVPRVLSGTFGDNVLLDHADRTLHPAVDDARLGRDLEEAGGPDSLVGHRGVRLSGGQVQRLALARALATDAELLLADDVSSALDATTEIELWSALRERGTTVLGSTSKAAALALADTVVVLVDGRIAAQGPWTELSSTWGHLAG
ncbi:ABC transporter ATP-binding protein [uncultured Nocardioides sp.]|uniref:ATP-binding cassette domain-containing protein n=1 Tax=uncultured Nocardioides sp. TaxID=198441 RepID=UPI0026345931|nr:ABC transporter ATP-binding protein [uncultured Nocardioides sp.]